MLTTDIITQVRNMAGDVNVLQFGDDQIVAWINNGIRECAIQNNLLQKRATQNLVVGQENYALPTDILKMHSVKIDNAKIRVTTLDDFEDNYGATAANTGNADPEICYVWAGNLTVYPKPARATSLVIDYIYDPYTITNDSNAATGKQLAPPLPISYHMRLIDYCLAQVAQQDDDMNRYQIKMQEFTTGVSDLKDQPEWEYDSYPMMGVSARDSGSGIEW